MYTNLFEDCHDENGKKTSVKDTIHFCQYMHNWTQSLSHSLENKH